MMNNFGNGTWTMSFDTIHKQSRFQPPAVQVGRGAYGAVARVFDKTLKKNIAVKEVETGTGLEKTGYQHVLYVTTEHEISYLTKLKNHPNIVQLLEVIRDGPFTLILLELMETDLRKYLSANIAGKHPPIPNNCAHSFAFQLLYGLKHMHSENIIHRDLKPSNLLINKSTGVLKIADFGLASKCTGSVRDNNTKNVITLWYRPVELLLKQKVYGKAIDIWSAGCIILELFHNNIAFHGSNVNDQLIRIFGSFGSPTELAWPGITELYNMNNFPEEHRHYEATPLTKNFPLLEHNYHAAHLVSALLVCNPLERISAEDALQMPYFSYIEHPS